MRNAKSFKVTYTCTKAGETRNVSIRVKGFQIGMVIASGRNQLAALGWDVGACLECKDKLQSYHVNGR